MLTIKHVEKSGHESAQMALSVSFTPKGYTLDSDTPAPRAKLIAFGCTGRGGPVDQDGVCRYGDGIVYIMNDAGATIARYDLD